MEFKITKDENTKEFYSLTIEYMHGDGDADTTEKFTFSLKETEKLRTYIIFLEALCNSSTSIDTDEIDFDDIDDVYVAVYDNIRVSDCTCDGIAAEIQGYKLFLYKGKVSYPIEIKYSIDDNEELTSLKKLLNG